MLCGTSATPQPIGCGRRLRRKQNPHEGSGRRSGDRIMLYQYDLQWIPYIANLLYNALYHTPNRQRREDLQLPYLLSSAQ